MSSNNNICLIGGSGFIGTELAAQLIDAGKSIRVLSRDLRKTKSLRVVPTVDVQQIDPHNEESLTKALTNQDVVINLVGILNQSIGKGETFAEAHSELAKNIAAASKKAGVKQIIQISALHADAENGPSAYLRTKGEACDILKAGGVPLTIFCPSVVFGNGDSLFTRFANLLHAMPFLPLACSDAKFAPVYVGDVAQQIGQAIDDPDFIGKSINLCGPEVFTLREIVQYTADVLEIKRPIICLPKGIGKVQAWMMEWIPGKPFSRDNYNSMQIDSVCNDCDSLQPTSVQKIVPTYLGKMNRQSRLQHYRELAHRDEHP